VIFYLGTHLPNWLGQVPLPLCVSRARLWKRKSFPRASAPWVLDSGAFSELSTHGGWTVPAAAWAAEARRFAFEIGRPDWCAVQDWMCEGEILGKTGLSVADHQEKTIESYRDLQQRAPDLPWLPVLQGFTRDEYLAHREMYEAAGVDLTLAPSVGVGSICRRQGTREVAVILSDHRDLPLHAFGLKMGGLSRCGTMIASADSLAWSYDGRRSAPLPGHETRHKNCANCLEWALNWRDRLLSAPMQGVLSFG
jgi:hypothetical protein